MKYLAASFLIFIVSFFGLMSPIREGTSFIFMPLQVGLKNSATEIKSFFTFFSGLNSIQVQNKELRDENRALKDLLSTYKTYQSENILLKQQLDLKEDIFQDREMLIANVLGNPSDKSGNSIIIDRGLRHGVEKGNNVVVGKSLVGVVKNAESGRSVVDLVTSPNLVITAVDVDSPNSAEGVVSGQFGTSIVMTKILPSDVIVKGDTIITTGRDGIVEPNLVIGQIARIEGDASDTLRTAFIESNIDLVKISKVFVLIY